MHPLKLAILITATWFASGVMLKLTTPSYKDGQIDYANGIIKYELVEQADKSMKWERIEEQGK